MPDADLSFDQVKTLLDAAVAAFRGLGDPGREAKGRQMAEYLARHPDFEDSGAEGGVAWGRVRNGGLVLFDASGNDRGAFDPSTMPPRIPAPEDRGSAADRLRAKLMAVTSQIAPLMAGIGTLPDNEWQDRYAAAVASLRSLAAELPGTDAEKQERDRQLAALRTSGSGGPGGREQQVTAFTAALSGLMQSIAASTVPGSTTPQPAPGSTTPQPAAGPLAPSSRHRGLPYSKIARLYTPFPTVEWFGNASEYLRKYDYDVAIVENAGVAEFMKLPECGVLAISGHSSNLSVRLHHDPQNPAAPGELEQVFSVYTASPVNLATWSEYLALWHAGMLAIYHPEGEDLRCNWAITDRFVRTYWSFAKNAFVYLDTCHPLRLVSEQFRTALHARGASVIAGWTWRGIYNIAAETAAFVFDRLLGANELVATFPVPVPSEQDATGKKQRPFDWAAVQEDMRKKGLGQAYDSKYGEMSELMFDPVGPGDFGLLRPSIKYVEVDEEESTLTLHGLFGQRQNRGEKVTVNGVELAIKEWSSEGDRILCEGLPQKGDGSEGPVVVEINGIQSNRVPLSGWHGDFTYKLEKAGEQIATVNFPVFLRGDVHRVRDRPGEQPHPRPTGVGMARDHDKKLSWSLGGSCQHGKKTYRWSGSGSLLPMDDPGGPFAVFIRYQVENGAFPQLYVDVATPPQQSQYSIEEDGKTILSNGPWSIIVCWDYETALDMEVLKSEVIWDPQFDISGKTRTWTLDFTGDHNPKIFQATLQWDEIQAQFPPDDDTAT